MELDKATKIAVKYWELFKPFCSRVKIAGSIRRDKSEVGDIELVCVPLETETEDGLFERKLVRNPEFVILVNSFNRVKGNGEGKYAQLILPEGINLDLFIANKDNFGLIYMIRTGSAAFSERMVTMIKKNGFYCKDGYLWSLNNNKMIPVPEEKDFFRITGIEYVEPFLRVL